MVSELDLPGLHKIASDLSDKYQFNYLWLIRIEYFCLILASTLALDLSNAPVYFITYALIFLAGLAVLLTRSFTKPEQSWYRARAVAESVKTSAWRYAMASHPYNGTDARREFLTLIREVLRANKILSEGGSSPYVGSDQITASMGLIRSLPLEERKVFYLANRVSEQRFWYVKKARANKRAFKIWVWVSGACYVIAVVLALSHIASPTWKVVPIEPLIVVASSTIGWVQIKKHSELAASYTLTATEIGLALEEANHLDDEQNFSDFVNDTELAFSREHTQWVARQQTAG